MQVVTERDVQEVSEGVFLARLREVTERYLTSIEAFEEQYRESFRVLVPGPLLEPLRQEYVRARKEFQECVPRARQLCTRYGLREPWQAMLHVSLGAETPQIGTTIALGFAEKALIADVLAELEKASMTPIEAAPPYVQESKGVLERIRGYFV